MIDDRKTFKDITELTLASLDGSISSDDFAILQDKIKNSKEARRHYLECLAVCTCLNQYEEESANLPVSHNLSEEDYLNDALLALAENEKSAVAVEVEKPQEPKTEFVKKIQVVQQKRHISRLSIFTLVLSTAAMLFIAALVLFTPIKPIVATLTESRDAVWAGSDEALIEGTEFRQGPLSLTSGYAGIVLTNGVEIVMHGPVIIDIESETQVFLSRGSIFSRVPKGAGSFLVRTTSATVVDYGTEFVVEVDSRGTTAAHVFKGEVELRAGADIVKHGPVKRLLANQAAAVDIEGSIAEVEFTPEQFVTSVPSNYDMAVLKSDPVAYWRFANYGNPINEINSRTYIARYVGNISSTNSSNLNSDIHDQALKLEGKGQHVAVTINRQTPRRGWSYAMWIRPELQTAMQEDTNNYYVLVGAGQYGHLTLSNEGRLEHCFRHNDGTTSRKQVSNDTIESGRWYHIVVTVGYDGTKRLYINGAEASEPINRETASLGTSNRCKEILIGTVFEKSSAFKKGPMDKSFKGDISQVALYDRALSGNAVKEIYSSSHN